MSSRWQPGWRSRCGRTRASRMDRRTGSRTDSLKRPSAEEVVLDDAVERPHAVLPADLLAFLVGAAVVGDAHLVDAAVQLRHLGRELGLDAEARLLDVDGLDDLAAE